MHFSDPEQSCEPVYTNEGEEIKCFQSPFLAEYIVAAYKYAVAIASLIAVIMIIVAGFQWTIAGGNTDMITSAKKKIGGAITGLVIALGSYALLYTINPELTNYRSLKIQYIRTRYLSEFVDAENETELAEGGILAIDFRAPAKPNITGGGMKKVPSDLTEDLEKVADKLSPDYGFLITSSFRTPEEQIAIIKDHCNNLPGSRTCDHKPDKTTACPMFGNPPDPKNCPHTTGHALDIWATKKIGAGWEQCIKMRASECQSNKEACLNDPCQKALIDAMRAQGFCRLDAEPWHFEKPIMSKGACH
ncbi:MAG: hypothetical protein HY984_00135 [Candidatus Magasanikbacteria bacterium]|nr:hypothetical protein [Candidatus Magasanikbacteria bacterium]